MMHVGPMVVLQTVSDLALYSTVRRPCLISTAVLPVYKYTSISMIFSSIVSGKTWKAMTPFCLCFTTILLWLGTYIQPGGVPWPTPIQSHQKTSQV